MGAFGERALFRNWQSLHGPPHPQPQDRDLTGAEVGWVRTFRWKVVEVAFPDRGGGAVYLITTDSLF